jgi:glycosyltransferase involved in cell wall biosynthesis
VKPVVIAIPCYNEAGRFNGKQVDELVEADLGVILVDDGSSDSTPDLIAEVCQRHPGSVESLAMIRNVGKAEAVRRGMNHAHALGANATGYLDGDFATPAEEMIRLVELFESDESVKVLLGSRWLHLGSKIKRSNLRHYCGRVFATFASMTLRMPVYDTQCGAKLFRITDTFLRAIDEPFSSTWAFDVELLARLEDGMGGTPYEIEDFIEVPLEVWTDVPGSKINLVGMIRATLELIPIWRTRSK